VLHPTETVVSLSGDPYDARAVASARELKGYAEARPFVCLVPGSDRARALARDWPSAAEVLARAFWPGPLTLVVPSAADAPAAVSSAGTIALRPAADPVSAALLASWNRPLFSTSANPRGRTPPTDVAQALADLAGAPGAGAIEVALVSLAPSTPGGRPSTIVDVGVSPPRLLREGAIPAGRVNAALAGLARD